MWLEIEFDRFYTIKQTAQILEVSEQTLWRWRKSWKLVCSDIGTSKRANYRIKGETILKLLTK